MKNFKTYIAEAKMPDKTVGFFRKWIELQMVQMNTKIVKSARGGYHTRFPVPGNIKYIERFFRNLDIAVKMDDTHISNKFETYKLTSTKKIGGIPKGTSILWVNNSITHSKRSGQLINNKDLSPDNLGLGGRVVNYNEIIQTVTPLLEDRYPENISKYLISLMKSSYTNSSKVSVATSTLSVADLRKVSADFGEILSAIWSFKIFGNKSVHFPSASNQPLIDFYSIESNGTERPVSVKSGQGGKVTIQNIINTIKSSATDAKGIQSSEAASDIFKIAKENNAKEGMIKLHIHMQTPAIKLLGKIMGIGFTNISVPSIDQWMNGKTDEEINEQLKPFWKKLNMNLSDKVMYSTDRKRRIVSPLGESIWKVLNDDKNIKKSLTNLANRVTVIQININVKKKTMVFKKSKFSDASFKFSWAGYAAGNKLGFSMET